MNNATAVIPHAKGSQYGIPKNVTPLYFQRPLEDTIISPIGPSIAADKKTKTSCLFFKIIKYRKLIIARLIVRRIGRIQKFDIIVNQNTKNITNTKAALIFLLIIKVSELNFLAWSKFSARPIVFFRQLGISGKETDL